MSAGQARRRVLRLSGWTAAPWDPSDPAPCRLYVGRPPLRALPFRAVRRSAPQDLCRQLGLIDAVVRLVQQARVRVFAANADLKSTQLGKHIMELGRSSHRYGRDGLARW